MYKQACYIDIACILSIVKNAVTVRFEFQYISLSKISQNLIYIYIYYHNHILSALFVFYLHLENHPVLGQDTTIRLLDMTWPGKETAITNHDKYENCEY